MCTAPLRTCRKSRWPVRTRGKRSTRSPITAGSGRPNAIISLSAGTKNPSGHSGQRSQPSRPFIFVETPLFDISRDQVRLGERTIPIAAHVDVLVCGGGVAGIAAAVAAARKEANTRLIERAGFLGGTATGSAMGLIVIPASELVGFPREFFSRLAREQ